MDHVVTDGAEQALRAEELLLRLAGEAHDDVGGQPQVRHRGPGAPDGGQVPVHGVEAAHPPQQRVVARLDRQVQLLADGGQVAHRLEEGQRRVARMGGQETQPPQARDVVHRRQQLGAGLCRCPGRGRS